MVSLNRFVGRPQSGDDRLFPSDKIGLRPLFGKLRKVQDYETKRQELPSARFVNEPEFDFFGIHHGDRNKSQGLVHPRRPETIFDRGVGRAATQYNVAVSV